MSYKALLSTALALLVCHASYSQDKLYKKNGDMMEVNVTEITPRVVTFKKADNTNGPTYTINKADVARIEYDNGSEDVFGEVERDTKKLSKKPVKYGNNIISLMPMQLLTEGVGLGLAYERALDKNNILSFYLPVAVAFTSFNNAPGGTTIGSSSPMFYFMPGLKFYPTGGKGVVRYSVGPNIAYVTGEEYVNELLYDQNGNIIGQNQGMMSKSALGIMVTNGLNINPTPHIHIGLELGLGFTYFNQVGNVNYNTRELVQFGFKMGYRF